MSLRRKTGTSYIPPEHCRVDGLREIGLMNIHQQPTQEKLHAHTGAVELLIVVQGYRHIDVLDVPYDVPHLHVLVLPPDYEHHMSGNQSAHGVLYWVQIEADGKSPLSRHALALADHGAQVLTIDEQTATLCSNIFNEVASDDDLAPELAVSQLIQLLILLRRTPRQQQTPELPTDIVHIIDHVQTHISDNLTPTHLAGLIGISTSSLNKRFRKHLGCSPQAWIQDERIRSAAQQLYHTQQSILTIALDLGFSSSQYFATVFKKYMRVSPQQYRDAAQQTSV